jgi:hypothetical protein
MTREEEPMPCYTCGEDLPEGFTWNCPTCSEKEAAAHLADLDREENLTLSRLTSEA